MAATPKKLRNLQQRLSRQVQKQVIAGVQPASEDLLDQDLLAYVRGLMAEMSRVGPMGKLDLSSPEQALQAVKEIEARKAILEQQLNNTRLLSRLLKERQAELAAADPQELSIRKLKH